MKTAIFGRLKEILHLHEAEMSHSDVRSHLRTALYDAVDVGEEGYLWVVDVYDESVVYEVTDDSDSTLFRRDYTMDDDGNPSFGDPVEVKRVTTYEPVTIPATESIGAPSGPDNAFLTDEIVPLIERAVSDDGLVDIKVIQPGWGSSGYYSADVLKSAAAIVKPGTHMYIDHPTQTDELERPERSLKELAAVTVEDAVWQADGLQGPGLYTRAKTFSGFRDVLDEIAPHIGVSIRGSGRRSPGQVEGRDGLIVNEIADIASIDFVTLPGAGGAIGELVESARSGSNPKGAEPVTEQHTPQPAAAENTELSEVRQELARMQEREVLRDARELVERNLRGRRLPDIVVSRLTERLAANPPYTDDRALDREGLTARIDEAVTAELAYLEQIAPSGRVTGMGGRPANEDEEIDEAALEADLTAGFGALGLSETAAKRAAAF